MNIDAATGGWFGTTITTNTSGVSLYPTFSSINLQAYPQPVVPAKSTIMDPLDWLRSRVGEYVEAGALA